MGRAYTDGGRREDRSESRWVRAAGWRRAPLDVTWPRQNRHSVRFGRHLPMITSAQWILECIAGRGLRSGVRTSRQGQTPSCT